MAPTATKLATALVRAYDVCLVTIAHDGSAVCFQSTGVPVNNVCTALDI